MDILVRPLSFLTHLERGTLPLYPNCYPPSMDDKGLNMWREFSYQGKGGESKCKPTDLEICQSSYKYDERTIRIGDFILKWSLFLHRNVCLRLFSLIFPLWKYAVPATLSSLPKESGGYPNTFGAAVLSLDWRLESPAKGGWREQGLFKNTSDPKWNQSGIGAARSLHILRWF